MLKHDAMTEASAGFLQKKRYSISAEVWPMMSVLVYGSIFLLCWGYHSLSRWSLVLFLLQ